MGREDGVITVCVLGSAGAGKSSTCNSLFGCRSNDAFQVSHSTASVTDAPEVQVLPWRGAGPPVRCVDLPGLSGDGDQVAEVVASLRREVREVHAFLLVLNGASPRFDFQLQRALLRLAQLLGGGAFLRAAVLAFTHWDLTRAAKRQRRRSGRGEAWKAAETNRELRALLGHGFDLPAVFLDNDLNSCSDSELEEEFGPCWPEAVLELEAELEKILAFARAREPFDCRGLRVPAPCSFGAANVACPVPRGLATGNRKPGKPCGEGRPAGRERQSRVWAAFAPVFQDWQAHLQCLEGPVPTS